MRRRPPIAAGLDPDALDRLLDRSGALGIDERVDAAATLLASSAEHANVVLRFILQHCSELQSGVDELQRGLTELQKVNAELLQPPWYPATYLRAVEGGNPGRVLVWMAGGHRVVPLAEGVDAGALSAGDEVYIGTGMNAVVAHSPGVRPRCGETAAFERLEADGRLVVRWRDEELVIDAAAALDVDGLRAGDRLRWNRDIWMAFERLQPAAARRYLLDEVPDVGRDSLGGQDDAIDQLVCALAAKLAHPEAAARYGYGDRQTVLLHGPPGCGKTSMARVAAAELARLSGRRCRFAVVKPAEWEAPYVGETQQNIRDCFQSLREAAAESMVVLFLDEIEAVGRIRGAQVGHHSDRALAALLTELDGFASRSPIAVIAATNRKELVDPALLERLSDLELRVERPSLDAARAILAIHLPEHLPFHHGAGAAPRDSRRRVIETALSRLYGANADADLCRLRFRDSGSRAIAARELMSGRLLEQICRAARRRALWREIRLGDTGIRVADMEEACADALERLASTLSRHNARAYLDVLPQDVDIVAVEVTPRRPARSHRYLQVEEGLVA